MHRQYGQILEYAPRHPPGLGEHTVEVLRDIGLGAAAIERLAAEGAIGPISLPAPTPARRAARKPRRTR